MSKGYRIPRGAAMHILRLCENDILDSDDCIRGNAVDDIRAILYNLHRLENPYRTAQVQPESGWAKDITFENDLK